MEIGKNGLIKLKLISQIIVFLFIK